MPDSGTVDVAERLTDGGAGYLILFPQSGVPVSAPRRRELVDGDESRAGAAFGIELPPELVGRAAAVASRVREHLGERRLEADAGTPDPTAFSTALVAMRDTDIEVLDAEPVLEDDPQRVDVPSQPRDGSSSAVLVLARGRPGDPGSPAVAIVPLRMLSERRDGGLPARHRRSSRVTRMVAVAVLLSTAGVVFLVSHHTSGGRGPGSGYGKQVLVTVLNVVTNGPRDVRQDRTPLLLSTRLIPFCGLHHCLIQGTARHLGQTYDGAVCQARGVRTTNGNDHSHGDDRNPQLRSSTRYLGIRLFDDTFGYTSVVWLAPEAQGGLGLPTCRGV
jgi:hypothetical protein